MNWRPTFMVWLLAIAGGVLAWVVVGSPATRPSDATSGPRPLLTPEALPLERLERIVLRRGTDPPMTFVRQGDGWMQEAPFAYPMDPFSVRQLATAALELETSRRIGTDDLAVGSSLAALALDPPEAVVEFEWPDGRRRIDLGRLGVAGRAFVRLDGADQVDVVGQALHERVLGMDPREWRQRRLLPEASVECSRIEIVAGDSRTVLERDQRRWRLAEPVRTRIDQSALESFLQGVASAQCSGFIVDQPSELAPFGLAPPAGVLAVTCGREGGSTRRLLVGNPIAVGGQDRFGMMEGTPVVLRLSGDALARLFPGAASLIDPTPCSVRPEDVKRIRVKGPDADFALVRDLDVWRCPESDNREASPRAVANLLQQLTAARAGSIAIQPFPMELEVGFVTLIGFDLRPLATVRIAHEKDSGLWALESGDGVLRLFPKTFDVALDPEGYGLGAK